MHLSFLIFIQQIFNRNYTNDRWKFQNIDIVFVKDSQNALISEIEN